MVSKEYWANLSDEDKSKIIRRFCEINDIGPDFDYAMNILKSRGI